MHGEGIGEQIEKLKDVIRIFPESLMYTLLILTATSPNNDFINNKLEILKKYNKAFAVNLNAEGPSLS